MGKPDERQQQWQLRYQQPSVVPVAAQVLLDYAHLLPGTGRALDLACGLGGNALLLAEKGLQVQAWDYAQAALEQLQKIAGARQLTIGTQLRDVAQQPPAAESFDVLVVSRFLQRELCADLVRALNPNGLLFYQTFIRDKCAEVGPQRPDFLLESNELLGLFSSLRICAYREEAQLAADDSDYRNEAMLVAQKRA